MRRIRELDALRGIWAVLILLGHATGARIFAGWSRVDFFFVLSGYLATCRLTDARRSEVGLTTLYVRRLLRLAPAYYLLLFTIVLFDPQRWEYDQIFGFFKALTFSQEIPYYWTDNVPYYFPQYLIHIWALAIEMQFSLLFPALVRLTGRGGLAPIALWSVVNCVVLRACGLHPWVLLARGDGLALGILLALVLGKPGRADSRTTKLGLAFAGSLGLGYMAWYLTASGPVPKAFDLPLGIRESLAAFANNLVYTALVGLFVCHAGQPVLRPFRAGWLGQLGSLSYGIYVYSIAAIALVGEALGIPRSGGTALLVLALAIAAAAASRALIERPLQRLVRRRGTEPADLPNPARCGEYQPMG